MSTKQEALGILSTDDVIYTLERHVAAEVTFPSLRTVPLNFLIKTSQTFEIEYRHVVNTDIHL
jgi:hypothetical protein